MSKTILILANNSAQLHSLKLVVIEKLKHQAITQTTTTAALDFIFSNKQPAPDLLLLDISGEISNWLKFIRTIKKRNPDFPIIIITKYGEHEYATQAIEAGANDFLTIPIATARLKLSISNALRLRHLQQTIHKLEQKLEINGKYIPPQNQPTLATLSPIDNNGKIKKLRTIEDEAIRFALVNCSNSMSKAAQMLGIGRSTIYRKLGELEN
jgi:DNA-binding NtrC family response regulator